jgi:hypothetical protein
MVQTKPASCAALPMTSPRRESVGWQLGNAQKHLTQPKPALPLAHEHRWRGFCAPRTPTPPRALAAALLLAAKWAVWYWPLFLILAGYRSFRSASLVGFVFGLTCDPIELIWVYNGSGASVLIAALRHATYNLTAATSGARAAWRWLQPRW